MEVGVRLRAINSPIVGELNWLLFNAETELEERTPTTIAVGFLCCMGSA
jgi:hypothetical protein